MPVTIKPISVSAAAGSAGQYVAIDGPLSKVSIVNVSTSPDQDFEYKVGSGDWKKLGRSEGAHLGDNLSDSGLYLRRVDGSGTSPLAEVSLENPAVPVLPTQEFQKGVTLKRFTDLRNVTITQGTGMTAVATIDQNSPFGGPALKLVLTSDATAARFVEVSVTAGLSIKNFDDHIVSEVWIDDATKLNSINSFLGTTDYAKLCQVNKNIFSGGDKIGGRRGIVCGPVKTKSVDTFVFGTDTLQAFKQRFTVPASQTATVWIREFSIPARQRPIIAMTWDDDYANWLTRVLPHLAANNIKATFNYNSEFYADVGGAKIGGDGLAQILAAGHQLTSHCVYNYKLQTVNSNGNGEDNGTNPNDARDPATYAAEYVVARNKLMEIGVPPEDLMGHAWVQGGMDTAAMELLRSEGVTLARTTSPYEINIYGFEQGNNMFAMHAFALGSGTTLQQAKDAVAQCIKYGGLLIFMGHNTADTSADSVTWAESNLAALCLDIGQKRAAGGCETMVLKEIVERFRAIGVVSEQAVNPKPVSRPIGRLLAANFNSTADQAIPLLPGSYVVTGVLAVKGSVSMTTAAGGVYSATAKGGTAIVAAGQTYTGLTGAATDVVSLPVTGATVSSNVYLSLTTPQGATATADVFVYGYPA